MFSPATIREMEYKAAREAARKGRRPFVIHDEAEIDRFPPFPFPFIGDHCPKGWAVITDDDGKDITLFVDTSGFGAADEPALTVNQLKNELRNWLKKGAEEKRTFGFALISLGQFQGYLGVFEKLKTK